MIGHINYTRADALLGLNRLRRDMLREVKASSTVVVDADAEFGRRIFRLW